MDDSKSKLENFIKFKQAALGRDDLSRKGSIDEPICSLVRTINNNEFYYTTSTCSGRITLIEKPHGEAGKKKDSRFHLSSHEAVELAKLNDVVESFSETCDKDEENKQCLWFKFEPFILHIQCYDLDKAKSLLSIALQNGCRNSGITLGKLDKIMLAIRSTSSMEIPVHCSSSFHLPRAYIDFICEEANRRLKENFNRLNKLEASIKDLLLK